MPVTRFAKLQLRRDSAADWTSNDPILLQGEVGINLDNGQGKIGDGSSLWSELAYAWGGTTTHNDLSGLQGGKTAEFYHLTAAQHTAVASTLTNLTTQYRGVFVDSAGTLMESSAIVTNAAGELIVTGSANIDGMTVGQGAGTGANNTAVGDEALLSNTTGQRSVGVGTNTLRTNEDGGNNLAIGYNCLRLNVSGSNCAAIGSGALYANLTSNNTGIGGSAMSDVNSGTENTAVGMEAGRFYGGGASKQTTCSQSVFIGARTDPAASGGVNQIVVGYQSIGNGSNTATWGNTSITDHYFAGNINMVTNDSYMYLRGDADTDGSVRMSYQSSDNMIKMESRASGTWAAEHSFPMANGG